MPSMSLATQVQGVTAAITAVAENATDIDDPIRSQWQ
jgi:hypothetical protein